MPPLEQADFRSIPSRFDEIARSNPDGLALRTPDLEFTFAEFDRLTNRIARAIPESRQRRPVAIVCTGEADIQSAQLGVLKSGRPMLPVRPGEPPPRLSLMIDESGADAVIVPTATAASDLEGDLHIVPLDELPADARPVDATIDPDHLAMLEYTSGSTGVPKGIAHDHRSLLHFALGFAELGIAESDRVLLASASFGEFLAALVTGAPLFPFDVRQRGFGKLPEWMREQAVSMFRSPPSVFRALAEHLRRTRLPDLRTVVQAGEALFPADLDLLTAVLEPQTTLVQMYGASEVGAICTHIIDREPRSGSGEIPIGTPLPDVEVKLVGPDGESVEPGEVGEMLVSSPALATGYFGRPELTRAQFFEAGGKRWFRTGDRARTDEAGRLVFAGRVDDLVKIRGKRVEIAEVEEAIRGVAGVAEAAVLARPDHRGSLRLIGYYSTDPRHELTTGDLRAALNELVPGYMIPTAWVAVDSFAMTSNGKIDRRALPEPRNTQPAGEGERSVPGRLEHIWCDLLGVDSVSGEDSFFDLGGDSLAAASLLAAVEHVFGCDIAMVDLFEDDRLVSMQAMIDSAASRHGDRLLFTISRGDGERPLVCVHMPGWSRIGYLALSRHMHDRRTILGVLEPEQAHPERFSVGATALAYADAIEAAIPGPYMLLGYSGAGIVAHETARLLIERGAEVAFLGLVDSGFPAGRLSMALRDRGLLGTARLAARLIWHKLRLILVRSPSDVAEAKTRHEQRALSRSIARHRIERVGADVTYFEAVGRGRRGQPARPWRRYANAVVEIVGTHGGPDSVMSEPNVEALADAVESRLLVVPGLRESPGPHH